MTRAEAWARLALASVGLVLVAVAVAVHGVTVGAGLVEVLGVGGVFCGWLAWSAARRLMVRDP